MKRIPIMVLVLVVAAGFAARGFAQQDEKREDQYYPELQNDEDMRVILSKKNMLSSGVQYGAWITQSYIHQESALNKLDTSVTTARVWLKTYLWDNSFLYVRGKDTYTGVIWQSGVSRTSNKNVADLDLGYIATASPRRDVDFSVGNVNFGGEVLIIRNVIDCFKVRSESTVTVQGVIEAAEVHAGE